MAYFQLNKSNKDQSVLFATDSSKQLANIDPIEPIITDAIVTYSENTGAATTQHKPTESFFTEKIQVIYFTLSTLQSISKLLHYLHNGQ